MWKENKESWNEATLVASTGIPWVLIFVIIVVAVSFGSWYLWAYFAPKTAAVQNEVFHQSQQYNDGMVRDLENLRMEYLRADETGKALLKSTILHRFAGYDELRSFYESLKN